MDTGKNSFPVILWGIAAGLTVISVHGGVPLTEGMQAYSLIEVPKPNSTWDIGVAALGGTIALFQYAIAKEIGVSYQIALGSSYVFVLGVIFFVNPTFTVLQRVGLVAGGLIGSLITFVQIE